MNQTLLLSQHNIQRCMNERLAIRAVEEAFREYGRKTAMMPPKVYLDLKRHNGDFRAMPAYLGKSKVASVKWVNVHPDNVKKKLPTVMAVIILSDPDTGFPLCVMDGTLITAVRTAAAGAVAAKYLASPSSRTVALVGCGVQARYQLSALRTLFRFDAVRVWGHRPVLAKEFIREMKTKREEMTACVSVKDCVRNADIIVTTTPSRKALVQAAWVKPGAHINAIGADAKGKQELSFDLIKSARIVVDDWVQASHSGEINKAVAKGVVREKDIAATLSEVVLGRKKGRRSSQDITVFDSTGLAIQDTAVASLIYRTARAKKTGTRFSLI